MIFFKYLVNNTQISTAERWYEFTSKVADTVFWLCAAAYTHWPAPMAHSVRLWFESRPCRMFVIDFVHIQCSKVFKSLQCASNVYDTVHYKKT